MKTSYIVYSTSIYSVISNRIELKVDMLITEANEHQLVIVKVIFY